MLDDRFEGEEEIDRLLEVEVASLEPADIGRLIRALNGVSEEQTGEIGHIDAEVERLLKERARREAKLGQVGVRITEAQELQVTPVPAAS